eukprot:CAMPEP_0170315648 /NCGR_PEP_ID=MMETSP0116_2-20130129/58432_1 /TAXON_ID=400756 /ORGANISM="Durinskia baltica, Strain CSIRO CS-38" /LENGTH=132 /DNA_ID=CAMNT_0010568167 /DNA_START=91 /DNA_END=486 /DNA_ORIENTATION=+
MAPVHAGTLRSSRASSPAPIKAPVAVNDENAIVANATPAGSTPLVAAEKVAKQPTAVPRELPAQPAEATAPAPATVEDLPRKAWSRGRRILVALVAALAGVVIVTWATFSAVRALGARACALAAALPGRISD